MFKYSLVIAVIAALIFLLKGDENQVKVKAKVNKDIYDDTYEVDDFDDYDFGDINLDEIDYDLLEDLEKQLNLLG